MIKYILISFVATSAVLLFKSIPNTNNDLSFTLESIVFLFPNLHMSDLLEFDFPNKTITVKYPEAQSPKEIIASMPNLKHVKDFSTSNLPMTNNDTLSAEQLARKHLECIKSGLWNDVYGTGEEIKVICEDYLLLLEKLKIANLRIDFISAFSKS